MESACDVVSELRSEGPLFSSSAISSQLRLLGYPEELISSMNRCQESTGGYYLSYCDCGASNGVHPLKHWCNLRTCPDCAKKRKRAIRRKYLNFLEKLPKTKLKQLYFLTISPKNYKSVDEGLALLKKNFSNFLRQKYIRDRIDGSLYVIEAKQIHKGQDIKDKYGKLLYIAKEDSWNMHIHAIIYSRRLDNRIRGHCNICHQNLILKNHLTKEFYCGSRGCGSKNVSVNQDSKLVTLWKKVSHNESVNIHITQQYDKQTRRFSPSYTLNYMLKYISANKDDFTDAKGIAQYIFSTKKRKLIGVTGSFFKYFKELNHKYKIGELEKPRPHCSICNSFISYVTCFELEPLLLRAEKERKDNLWLKKNFTRKKPVVSPPPEFHFDVTLSMF